MTQIVIRTDDALAFFDRAKNAARLADQGQAIAGRLTLSFEDPQRMFSVLSQARRMLMLEVMHEPKTINQLSVRLRRHRSTISKDVGVLEKLGLIVSKRESNPGHGMQKTVQAAASKIDMVATLG